MERLNTHVEGAFGIPITVGSLVAYPVRRGSSMWMSCGVVTGVEMKRRWWQKDKEDPILLVTTVTRNYRGGKIVLSSRKTKVSCVERVVPLDGNKVALSGPEGEFLLGLYYDVAAKFIKTFKESE